jgi:hypothetical protein
MSTVPGFRQGSEPLSCFPVRTHVLTLVPKCQQCTVICLERLFWCARRGHTHPGRACGRRCGSRRVRREVCRDCWLSWRPPRTGFRPRREPGSPAPAARQGTCFRCPVGRRWTEARLRSPPVVPLPAAGVAIDGRGWRWDNRCGPGRNGRCPQRRNPECEEQDQPRPANHRETGLQGALPPGERYRGPGDDHAPGIVRLRAGWPIAVRRCVYFRPTHWPATHSRYTEGTNAQDVPQEESQFVRIVGYHHVFVNT